MKNKALPLCGQRISGTDKRCERLAAVRFTWPGHEEQKVCVECGKMAKRLATSMGFELHVLPAHVSAYFPQSVGSHPGFTWLRYSDLLKEQADTLKAEVPESIIAAALLMASAQANVVAKELFDETSREIGDPTPAPKSDEPS